jgi:hypothetical protein
MKVRHKPFVLEAFQWTGGLEQQEDPPWAVEALKRGTLSFANIGTPEVLLRIETYRGTLEAKRGDWIIKGLYGELYPCQQDAFPQIYELVKEGSSKGVGT